MPESFTRDWFENNIYYCDKTSTNFCTFQDLGYNFHNMMSLLQTSFLHSVTNDKVVAFPGPCHMLKLAGTFGDIHTLVDANTQLTMVAYNRTCSTRK